MKNEKILRSKHVDAVLDWILQTEFEDFREFPSDGHVYYHAYAELEGDEAARALLAEFTNEAD